MAEVEITELSKMEAEESHLVGMAANGYPTLISKGLAEMVEEEIEAAKALDLSGAPREVAAKSDDDCPTCDGDGTVKSQKPCPDCDGSGESDDGTKCPTCDGDGVVKEQSTCPTCEGTGKMAKAAEPVVEVSKDGSLGALAMPQLSDGMPGSPAWEAEDAKRAMAAGQLVMQLGALIDQALAREQIEVQMGQSGDIMDVLDLEDARDAVGFILSKIAPFAFREEAEGTLAAKSGKRLSGASVTQLVETRKAGRAAIEAITSRLGNADPEVEKGIEVDEAQVKELLEAERGETVKAVLDALDSRKAAKGKSKAEKAERESAITLRVSEAAKAAGIEDEAAINALVDAALVAEGGKPETASKALESDDGIAKAVLSLSETLTKALGTFEERIAKMENQPERGGPIANPTGTGTSVAAKDAIDALRTLAPRGASPELLQDAAFKDIDAEILSLEPLAKAGIAEAATRLEVLTRNRSVAALKAFESARLGEAESGVDFAKAYHDGL